MTRRRKNHRFDEIVAKRRDPDALLNAVKGSTAVLPAMDEGESMLERC
jgi:hypothetical protein